MKIISLVTLILFISGVQAQSVYQASDSTAIDFTAEMVIKDSQYFIVPKLKLKTIGQKIQIPKQRVYVDGVAMQGFSNAKIFLLKKISRTFTYITLNRMHDYRSLEEADKNIDYKKGDVLYDTINLQHLYPIDIGEYCLILELTYLCKGEKITIQSRELFFSIPFRPKNGIY